MYALVGSVVPSLSEEGSEDSGVCCDRELHTCLFFMAVVRLGGYGSPSIVVIKLNTRFQYGLSL